jgi:hypothetical protein
MRKSIFGSILQTLSGAPRFVTRTNPETGETVQVPVQQTKGQLGRSILAGALTGMFSGMDARDAEGRHDPMKAAQQGFQAGTQLHEKQQAAAQGIEDEALARKQMTMKANLDTAHLTLALNQGKQNMFEKVAGNNQNGILKDALTYDQNLTDKSQPTAILKQNLTHDEALTALKGHWSDQLAQIDGYRQNENGDIVPTFTVLNPDVKVKMNEKSAADFARFNPQFQTAWDDTNGNIQMSLHQYAIAQNTLNSLDHMDSLFAQEADRLGLKNTDFADAVKSIPNGMRAVIEAENAIGSGGTPIDALRRLSTAQGGAQILAKLGITGDKVEDLYNKQLAAQREAQAVGDKAPADPAAVAQISVLAKRMGLSDAETAAASAELPKTGATRADVAKVLENIRHQHDTNAQLAASANRDSGDPAMIERVARNLVDNPSSLTTMRDIGTRGTQRLAIIDKAEQIAKAEGKTFDTGLVNQRVKFLEQYEDPKGKAAINRQAINNIMQHAADVSDLNQLNRRSNVKIVNTPVNALKDQFGDQVFTQYQTANGVLKDELGLYFAGGYSPTKDQQAMWDKIQSDTATPAQTEAFAKEVVRLATRRADTFNQQFKTNMGYDDPNMLTPQAKSAAERLGLGDAVAQFKSGGQLGGPVVQNAPKPPTMVSVQIPGQKPGAISADKIDAFKKKYPNAIIGQGQ